MEGFNSHLNMEQMNKALISLSEMYNKAAADGRPAPNEAEFRAYHLISLMASHGKFKGDQQAFLSMLQALRPEVRGAPMVQWALNVRAAFVAGNFVKFFNLVEEAAYLPACAAHTFFPAIRARALRTLSETLAPTSTRPVAVEVSWLEHVLRLDSEEEVVVLAASHGFTETSIISENDGTESQLAVLFVKGQYIDPPPPLMKKPSAWITSKAPGLRSVCVTSPASRPLTPEEISVLAEERRKQEEIRKEAVTAARAAATAAAQRRLEQAQAEAAQREAIAQAALRKQQLEVQAQHQAEQTRLETIRRAEEEAHRQRELALAADARRKAEEEAERLRKDAAERAAAEAARRAAAEAEARRIEAERRRRAAEEAERRRRIEEERRKAEELRRKVEALRVKVFERRYFEKWVTQMRRLVTERRRRERIAASLKACRVGIVPLQPEEVSAAEEALGGLGLGKDESSFQQGTVPTQHAEHDVERGALDLAPLLAPLLAQRNPETRSFIWKGAVLASNQESNMPTSNGTLTSHLLRWLHLQLSCGRIAASAAMGSVYVDGPIEIELRHGNSNNNGGSGGSLKSSAAASLMTCVSVSPPSQKISSAGKALAGASGIIIAAADGENTAMKTISELTAVLPPAAPALPVLLVATSDDQAQIWRTTWQTHCPHYPSHAISVVSANNNSSTGMVYSRTQLVQGLRWLGARSPIQPVLSVARLEDATRDALIAGMVAGSTLNSHSNSLNAAIEVVRSFVQASGASSEAAWQWPPPELSEGSLKGWYTKTTQTALLSALEDCRTSAVPSSEDSSVQQFLKIGQLAAIQQPLVMPASVHAEFCAELERRKQEARAAVVHMSKNAEQGVVVVGFISNGSGESPTRQQKRKWRHSPEGGPRDSPSDAGANSTRFRQTLVLLEQSLAAERSNERQFDQELEKAAGELGLKTTSATAVLENESAAAIEEDKIQEKTRDQNNGGGGSSQLRALQELNAELEKERKASRSLWQRMRATTSLLF